MTHEPNGEPRITLEIQTYYSKQYYETNLAHPPFK